MSTDHPSSESVNNPVNASENVAETSEAVEPAVENSAAAKTFAGSAGKDAGTGFDTEWVHLPREKALYDRSLANAITAAKCADEMRAKDVVVLDMTKIASIVDFFVIATGTSNRQMNAVVDEVNRRLKGEQGNTRLGLEGYRSEGNWILIDFGDVVLHVFTEEGRQLYDLENLKADAERIDWQNMTA